MQVSPDRTERTDPGSCVWHRVRRAGRWVGLSWPGTSHAEPAVVLHPRKKVLFDRAEGVSW